MTTLTRPPLSTLLDRLFAEADASEDALKQEMESFPPEQRAASRADYREFYARLKDHPLPVSRASGKLFYMLARSARAGRPNQSRKYRTPELGRDLESPREPGHARVQARHVLRSRRAACWI